jgi:hypothetical protein
MEKDTVLHCYLSYPFRPASGIPFIRDDPLGEPWRGCWTDQFVYFADNNCRKERVSAIAGDWKVFETKDYLDISQRKLI